MNARWTCMIPLLLLTSGAQAATPAPAPAPAPAPKAAELSLDIRPWTGDLDGMIQRRRIRVLVPYSKTLYFIDHGAPRGIAYDAIKEFEKELNTKLNRKLATSVHAVFIPTSRDQLLSGLAAGRGDLAIGTLTITPERLKIVDFTEPTWRDNSEIVVTGPGAPAINVVDDLAGQSIYVRKSSSYYESLTTLNERFKKEGKKEAILVEAPGELEDEDLIEMANAGLVKILIVDRPIADFWKQVFTSITLHPTVAVRTGAQAGWAMRKGSPQLKAALDPFIKTHGKGTAFGNMTFQKYLKSVKYVKNSTSEAEMKKFNAMVALFRHYGEEYQVDYLLMAAQGFQESRLDQAAKSQVGAVGVMQIMPATGKDMNVGDIGEVESNVHAGIKYMRFMMDQYYKNEPMTELNKMLITFASYNCGPGRMRGLRAETAKRGLDQNVWFGNIELVTADKIGQETVTYVSNIYKYYIAYKLSLAEMEKKKQAIEEVKKPGGR